MKVFPFGIQELAKPAGLVNLPHPVQVLVEIRGLEHHVLQAAGLDGIEQLVGSFNRAEHRRHGRRDMFAVLEDLHAMPRVAGGVGRHEDRLDPVVLDQFFERGIRLCAAGGLRQPGTTIRYEIADRHHLDVRVILEAERSGELANAVAHQPHTNPAVGDGLPGFGSIRVRGGLLESLNHFVLGAGRLLQGQGCGAQANRVQERAPREGVQGGMFL